jgi:hypothetical protein
VWLLLVLSLRLRKGVVAEEVIIGLVAQLVFGCCWCRPLCNRDGVVAAVHD